VGTIFPTPAGLLFHRQLVFVALVDAEPGAVQRHEALASEEDVADALGAPPDVTFPGRDQAPDIERNLAIAVIERGDARALPLRDNSIDGIITSPPYAIALDYI
jgi:hypothetical protein